MKNAARIARILTVVVFPACAAPVGTHAEDAPTTPPNVNLTESDLQFYKERVRPVLDTHCLKCHGEGEGKGGLLLSSRDAILRGGDSGPAVSLEDVDSSLLLEAVNYQTYEMPPSGKLPDEKIAILRDWIARGLPMPSNAGDTPAEPSHGPPQVNDETKRHWAFRPVERPLVPPVGEESWIANPIDAFVLARLEEAGLHPAPPTDRQTLIRRVTYDLTGLPPTPEEVDAFLADESPDAYELLVERLLDSPHYGEHWARYWLDLVRYAESNSFERDNPKPFVWRYRDYIIESLNNDKPYDRFILEQLAGDELDDPTAASMIATGYYRLGIWDDEPADPLLAFYDGLDDVAATTAQAFLGLTLNCARCHDHKLDPIPQRDYYQFVAFFRNIQHYGKRSDESVAEASLRSLSLPEESAHYEQRANAHERELATVRKQLERIEDMVIPSLEGGEKDDFQDVSSRRDILKRGVGRLIDEKTFAEYAALADQRDRLEQSPPQAVSPVLCIKEHGPEAPPTHVLIRGNPHAEGEPVEPGFPSVLSPPEPSIHPPAHGESSGRRRALAEWIASSENPLTARVMVNRIWQGHFGRGLVRTPNNFGLEGTVPTHPDLLDWLAAEFVERGWSVKAVHRLILLSNTFRMASSVDNETAQSVDPQNDLLWQFDMRRLRAEEIRDSILAVNGNLNLSKLFGPSIYPEIPPEVLAGQSRPGHGWPTSTGDDARRRSIYIHIKRSLMVPILAAFDVADTDFTCPARFSTTQPTQALGMLNSTFLGEQSRLLADLARQKGGDDAADQVRFVLRRVLQRGPSDTEVARGVELRSALEQDHGCTSDESLSYFCLTALNLNEFLYLD